ncbi:MAG: hypothetical protein ABIB71_07375 [Candidatus Woesearchaeota archaeon]
MFWITIIALLAIIIFLVLLKFIFKLTKIALVLLIIILIIAAGYYGMQELSNEEMPKDPAENISLEGQNTTSEDSPQIGTAPEEAVIQVK